MAIRSRNVSAANGVVSGGSIAMPYSSPICCTAWTKIDSRADRENLAGELPAHKGFKNLACLDTIDRDAENNEIRKLGLEYRPQFVGLGAFAGYQTEIFQHVGEKCADVLLAVGDASPRRHLPPPKRCGSFY